MSAKPRFQPRVGYALHDPKTIDGKGQWAAGPHRPSLQWTRVRVTDARDLTPEHAVEKVLQRAWDSGPSPLEWEISEWAQNAGMTARVVNGKVRVRRAKL